MENHCASKQAKVVKLVVNWCPIQRIVANFLIANLSSKVPILIGLLMNNTAQQQLDLIQHCKFAILSKIYQDVYMQDSLKYCIRLDQRSEKTSIYYFLSCFLHSD